MKKTINTEGLTDAQIDTVDAFIFAIQNQSKEGILRRYGSPNWEEPLLNKSLSIDVDYKIDLPTAENYLKGHKASGLKVGDRVKVTRAFLDFEGVFLTPAGIVDQIVGKEFVIKRDDREKGFTIRGYGANWSAPHFALEKVEPKYRPWTAKEALGKCISDKEYPNTAHLITSTGEEIVMINGGRFTYKEILADFIQLDETPCGILEEDKV